MYALFRKVHMYVGLLNLSILFVFGVAGLSATFEPAPDNRKEPDPQVEYRSFAVPPGLDDKAVADRVFEFLRLPLTSPIPQYAIHRDVNHDLALDFYTPDGVRRAVVLEKENRIRVEIHHASLASFLNALHATTVSDNASDWRIRLWTYYTEFSIWSLIGMSLSGVYLWLASRPRYRPARYAFAFGCAIFVFLYGVTR